MGHNVEGITYFVFFTDDVYGRILFGQCSSDMFNFFCFIVVVVAGFVFIVSLFYLVLFFMALWDIVLSLLGIPFIYGRGVRRPIPAILVLRSL